MAERHFRSRVVTNPSQSLPSLSTMAIETKLDAPVLVVDDDPKIQALVSTYLRREGLPVVTVGGGVPALEPFRRARPRLAALHLSLPLHHGSSLRRQVGPDRGLPPLR